jgi:hypothetical protein
VPVGAPARFVGVLDGSLAIILHQMLARWLQQSAQLVQRAHKCAVTDVELAFQLPQGHAVDVMLHGDMGQEAVAQQHPRQDPGSGSLDQLATMRAILLIQLVTDGLST